MKKAGILVLVIIILGGVTAYILRQRQQSGGKSVSDNVMQLTSSATPIPNNWRTYESDLGYRIKMPPNVLVDTEVGENSIRLIPDRESGDFGPVNFIYVSVVDRDTIDEKGRVYNYNSDQFLKLMGLDIGGGISVVPPRNNIPDLAGHFKYERLQNASIDEKVARVFINESPWEFPKGVGEIRFIIPTEETIYILGGYYGGDISYAVFTRKDVERIVSTFKII